DGIRAATVTGVQTCALPIWPAVLDTPPILSCLCVSSRPMATEITTQQQQSEIKTLIIKGKEQGYLTYAEVNDHLPDDIVDPEQKIGRASCRERAEGSEGQEG